MQDPAKSPFINHVSLSSYVHFFFFLKLNFEIVSVESASEMNACSQGPSSSCLSTWGYLLGCDFGAFTVMLELTPEHVRIFPAHSNPTVSLLLSKAFPLPGTLQPKHPCPFSSSLPSSSSSNSGSLGSPGGPLFGLMTSAARQQGGQRLEGGERRHHVH